MSPISLLKLNTTTTTTKGFILTFKRKKGTTLYSTMVSIPGATILLLKSFQLSGHTFDISSEALNIYYHRDFPLEFHP